MLAERLCSILVSSPLSSLMAPRSILCDMVLVMTVEPGYGGQAFIPETLDKIRALRNTADSRGLKSLDIEVDGGINDKTAPLAKAAGANVLVAGTGLFKAADMALANTLLKAPQKGAPC